MIYILLAFSIVVSEALEDHFEFPENFQFGVSTSAYQIEGGWNASGKGENIWDRITHTHSNFIKDQSNGDVACDSYHLWKTDVQLVKNLNVHFYRFSLSWSRLLPNGFTNFVNPDGVRYYNDIIDELLKNNIRPMVTLYHWDLPQPLQDLGGWPNPLLANYFEDYAKVAFELFGDRVKSWITFNEPFYICQHGYGNQGNAPAIPSSGIGDYLCGHTILKAHSRVYHLYDKKFRFLQKGEIGIALHSYWIEPKTNSSEDLEAAARALQMNLGWLAHPIFSSTGDYPPIMRQRIDEFSKAENFSFSRLPQFSEREIMEIRGSYDFLGINHYSTIRASNTDYEIDAPVSYLKDLSVTLEENQESEKSVFYMMQNVPWGFRRLLNWVKKEYENILIYVTENGFPDLGDIEDNGRIDYHRGYLNSLLDSIHLDKVNVKAYAVWSLLDNMEWKHGYTLKFGLYHVNLTDSSKRRTPKASVKFYKSVIESRTIPK